MKLLLASQFIIRKFQGLTQKNLVKNTKST